MRDFLGGFDFRGDRVLAPVGEFSGGEKARLTLALLVRQRPNLLLLDEPTNHLDIEMREALTEALQDYQGALIVVAHDRYLLRATADELWLVADGRLARFDGDLDDYRDWVLSGRRRAADTEAKPRERRDRKSEKRAQAEARQRRSAQRKPLQEQLEKLEQTLESLSAEKRALEAWLASSEAYVEAKKAQLLEAIAAQGDLNWRLAQAERQWLDLQELLEASTNSSSNPDPQ